jgi:hypothetical protein
MERLRHTRFRASARRLVAGVAVLAAAFGAVPLNAARADPAYDWYLATITAGPDGVENMHFHMAAVGTTTGDAPLVSGLGIAVDSRPIYLRAQNFGLGTRTISTSRGAGGLRVEIAPGLQLTSGFDVFSTIGHLDPGQTYAVVVFQSGAADGAPTTDWTIGSGTATVDVTYGAGSTAVTAGDPGDDGVAANVDGTGAGTVLATRTAPAGILGVAVSHCEACRGSWAAPDGRSGGWVMKASQLVRTRTPAFAAATPEVDVGSTGFGGPAGTWTFRWEGADNVRGNNPAEILYAPIGDAWQAFAPDPPRPSAACAAGTALLDQDTPAVRASAFVHEPSPGEVHVCVRVEDAVSHAGAGGELVVTSGGSGPLGPPAVSTDTDACTSGPPNHAPGPHPYVGQAVLGKQVVLDVFQDADRAMVCVSVAGVGAVNVVVPYPAGVPRVELHPDPVVYGVG